MIFAEIDWTTLLTNVGVAVVAVIGALGGWSLKIRQNKQNHEINHAKMLFEFEQKKAEQDRKDKIADEEREERRSKREKTSDGKKEKELIDNLYKLMEAKDQEHVKDRDEIHSLRNAIELVSKQLELCKRGHNQQIKITKMIFDKLGMDYDEELAKFVKTPKMPGSKIHNALTGQQILEMIQAQSEEDVNDE